MRAFDYFSPASVEEACRLLAEFGADAQIIAGGTDVLIELRKPGTRAPKAIIDISHVKELKGIGESGDTVIIKPMTTHAEIFRSPIIQRTAPFLRLAVATIGSPQIRNRGTIGGNIMNAAACADTVPPLMALGAEVVLCSADTERIIPMTELFIKPYQTVANRGEILTEIRYAKLPDGSAGAFIKLGRRNALAISRLSVAAVLARDRSGTITEARIVPGSAFPKWQRIVDAEMMLVGKMPSAELFMHAGRRVSEVMISYTGRRWSTEYKEPVIAALVRRALEACI